MLLVSHARLGQRQLPEQVLRVARGRLGREQLQVLLVSHARLGRRQLPEQVLRVARGRLGRRQLPEQVSSCVLHVADWDGDSYLNRCQVVCCTWQIGTQTVT